MQNGLPEFLACPRDHQPRRRAPDGSLGCAAGHRYPVVEGVPVLLLDESAHTLGVEDSVLRRARGETAGDQRAPELHLESLGLSDDQLEGIARLWRAGTSAVDPAVQYLVGATCGIAYEEVIGRLSEYPIPEIPLPRSQGKHLVDLGCNWGRWSMAAARKGYRVIGVDPQLGAVISARRVAHQLGLSAGFVCGDARHLPIRTAQVDTVFSYSVQKWLRLFEQLSPIYKWIPGGLNGAELSTAAGVACDERPTRWATRGAPRDSSYAASANFGRLATYFSRGVSRSRLE